MGGRRTGDPAGVARGQRLALFSRFLGRFTCSDKQFPLSLGKGSSLEEHNQPVQSPLLENCVSFWLEVYPPEPVNTKHD